MSGPDVSDEATGLPPLDEIGDDPAMLLMDWAAGPGVVVSALSGKTDACRYLHLRGVIEGPNGPEWAQTHIAVSLDHAMDLAAAIAGGVA